MKLNKYIFIGIIGLSFLIPSGVFASEVFGTLKTYVLDDGISLCKGNFACYYHDINTIIFDSKIMKLPQDMRVFTILHELGHATLWNTDKTEKGADRFAESILGYNPYL